MAFYDFRKEYLKTLPVKQFGRSYDEKSKNVAKALGISKKELDQRESFITSSAKPAPTRNMKNNDGYNAEDWDRYFQQANPSPKPTIKPQSSKLGELFHNLGKQPLVKDITTPLKMYGKGVHNLFDGDPNTTFTGAFKAAVNKAESTDRSKVTKELTRGLTRTANSALLGSLDEAYKKTHNGESAVQFQSRKGGGKAADFAYDALGLFAPGAGAYKGANAGIKVALKGLGKSTEQKGLAKLGKLAIEGGTAGALLGTGQVGVREALNGKDYSAKQNAETIGLNTLLGAVGDPLLHGAGITLKGASEKAIKNLLPDSKDLGKRLGNALMTGEKSDLPKKTQNEIASAIENITPKGRKIKTLSSNSVGKLKTSENPFEAITPSSGGKLKEVPTPVNHDVPFNPNEALPDTTGHIGTKTKKESPGLAAIKNKAYINTIDNLHPLNEFDKMVEKVTGNKLKPSESTYTLGLNSRGSDQISKQILTSAMVNKNGEAIGKSLKDIASQVPKGKLKEFEDYLINKHAITRQTRGEKVFPDEMKMNAQKSEAKVKQYEQANPKFKELADQYYEYNKQLGKTWLVDTGILSKDQWDSYLKANPHYTPMHRIFKDIERPSFTNNAKKGFSNQSNPIKKATGSQRQIVSPIESTIEHTDKYVKTAKRNEVMQTFINNVQKNPEAFKDIAEIVPTKETPQSVLDTLNKDGVDGVLEQFNQGFEQKPDLTKGNVLFGLVDGKKVHVKVHDPQLLEALTNLQPKAQNIVIQSVGQLTRVMKNLTTGINPVFSLTRNIWRDIPTAYVNSKTTSNPFVFGKDLVGSVVSVMKNGDLYKSFKAVGGGHSSPVSSDVNLLAQSKRSILPQKGVKPLFGKVLGGLENLNNAVEAAPRLAEFKRATKNDSSYDAKMKGLFEANDVTVNFNKRGNVAKDIDAFIPYLNAALQGLDKTYRAFKENPIKVTTKAFTAMTIPTIALYVVNHKDPNYQQLSNYIKDNNFLIPNGDGTFTKIPKPRELGPAFSSSVERVLRKWNEQDPEAFDSFGKTILENFMPPTRTVLHPALVDTVANKNFMGTPIVPGDLQNLSPKYQYDAKTSELAKGIGKVFNKSPKMIDYLISSYGGGLAELGLPALTKDATIGNTLKQKVTADPVFSNDLLTKFYDQKTKLDQAQYDYTKQGVKSANRNDDLRKEFGSASRDISKVRKSIKALQGDSTLTPEERQKQIRILQQRINEMATKALNDSR